MMQNPQYYFGLPGDLIALPRPTRGMEVATYQGRVAHGLIGGGAAVTARTRLRRSWKLDFPWLDEATAQSITDYVQGVYGVGPFRLIDPMFRNLLPLNASVAGRVSGDPKSGRLASWRPGGGDTLTLEPTTTAPPFRPSGVMRWTGAVAGDFIVLGSRDETLGSGAPIFDEPNEIPIVPGESIGFSFWAKLLSGTSATLTARQHGLTAAGAAATSSAGTGVALTASWQQVTYLATQATLGATAVYARPVVGCTAAAGSPVIQISAPHLEYGPAVSTDYRTGWGVPRVVIVEEPGQVLEMLGNRSLSLTVREV